MKGAPLASEPECYYRVTQNHAALGQIETGAIIEGDGRLVPVEPRDGAQVVMDCWNLGTGVVRGPAVVINQVGKGRAIYIAGSLEANYLYDRVESTSRLLAAMVKFLAGGAPVPFKLEAPRGVYGVLRRASNGDLALWVLGNVGFKDADAGLMRQEYVPIPEVKVSILVPQGRQAKAMRFMRANQSADFRLEDGYAVTVLPSLSIAEVVHLELA